MSRRPATWSPAELPDQAGRTAVVTGSSTGVGWYVALALARRGGRVVLAGRDPGRLDRAAAAIRREVADPSLAALTVDLADLASVRAAAASPDLPPVVDLLVNNAAVMATPHRRTRDGLELQLATNHFGPFLLTGLLLPRLAAGGRVVTVSSSAHRWARSAPLRPARDPDATYRRWRAYAESKLANLLFTFELQRRSTRAGLPVRALAAHPGYAATTLASAGLLGGRVRAASSILDAVVAATAQPAADGALPVLMAATADLPGGTYCGPSGFGETRGLPTVVGTSRLARDEVAQRRLWELSEQTVGLRYP